MMDAKEMKLLTGAKTKLAAIGILYARLEKRNWSYAGIPARIAGYDYKKNLVHFTQTESAGENSCWHRRVYFSMADALDCVSGNLSNV